jgi:MFS family permease
MRKESIILILAFASGVEQSLGPMVTPGLGIVADKYGVSADLVASLLIEFFSFWIGVTTFFTSAGASVWGKRPFFVISVIVLLATNIWGYFTTSFVALAVVRVLQGMASAPLETLVTTVVADMYFVHERGIRISIWGCFQGCGVLLGSIISGIIIENVSFEAVFGVAALIFIPVVLGMYFFVFETTYTGIRPSDKIEFEPEDKYPLWEENTETSKTYLQRLQLFPGRLTNESFWRNVWIPLPLTAFPAVLFSTIVFTINATWLLTISVLAATIFAQPPYNLSPSQVGLTNLPLLIFVLINSPLSGWAADWVARVMACRNDGVFEPEFRLLLMIPAVVFATIGFLGFGISAQQGAPLVQLLTFMTIHPLSVPFSTTAAFTYVVDCHPRDANQAFVMINFTKSVLTFISLTYANGIMASIGPQNTFFAITMVNLAIGAMTVPTYIFGKKLRSVVSDGEHSSS